MINKVVSKDRAEWLQNRQGGIGSSEVSTILGLNKYKSPLQLWREKVGLEAPRAENTAMRLGHKLEPVVADEWEYTTGRKYLRNTAKDYIVFRDEAPWRRVSPDREFKVGKSRGILECKSTMMTVDEDLLRCWYVQLQYQLGVCGYEFGSVAWLKNGRELDYQDFDFSPATFEHICSAVDEFWHKNILEGIQPDAMTEEDSKILWPSHLAGKTTEATAEIMAAVNTVKDCERVIKSLEKQVEEEKLKIKLALQDAEMLVVGGQTIATYRSAKDSEKFDSKAFCEAYPELAQQFMKSVQGSRRLLIR